jgi:hypothetical protein
MVSENVHLPTERIYEETGWFIRRLEPYGDEDNHVSCFDEEDLARSVMYALSHAGDYDADHYRFFGSLSNEPASEDQERRASSVCRSYCHHILGMPSSSVSCEKDVSEDDETEPDRTGISSGAGSGSSSASTAESTESEDADYMPCGGRLRHIQQLPDILDKRDWPDDVVSKLKLKYEQATGEPPPD